MKTADEYRDSLARLDESLRSAILVVAIVGHTNVGKTALARTLSRTDTGIVADRAAVTQSPEAVPFSDLSSGCTLIDCPGFQHVEALRLLNRVKDQETLQGLQDWFVRDRNGSAFHDYVALAALRRAHIAIYLATLHEEPEEIHEQELLVLKEVGVPTLAILNGGRRATEADGHQAVNARRVAWTKTFGAGGLSGGIEIDAFWYSPKNAHELYRSLLRTFEDGLEPIRERFPSAGSTLARFHEGIQDYEARLETTLSEASAKLASTVIAIRSDRESGSISTDSRDDMCELETRLCERIVQHVVDLRSWLLSRFAYSLETDGWEYEIRESSAKDVERILAGARNFGALGGIAGGGVGALIGFLLIPGGAGALAGAKLGAALGATLLAGTGFAVNLEHKKATVTLKPETVARLSEELLFQTRLAIRYGYGQAGSPLLWGEIRRFRKDFESRQETAANIEWSAKRAVLLDEVWKRLAGLYPVQVRTRKRRSVSVDP